MAADRWQMGVIHSTTHTGDSLYERMEIVYCRCVSHTVKSRGEGLIFLLRAALEEESLVWEERRPCGSVWTIGLINFFGPQRSPLEADDILLRVDFVREVDALLQEVRQEHSGEQNVEGLDPESVTRKLKQPEKQRTITQSRSSARHGH
ncbi:hypothetical protein NC652_007264 [Populus alba x Populus x berolinensis]|nr:hypothetical protein NC652_007264 [Populus alba x Populus x berolinensis]